MGEMIKFGIKVAMTIACAVALVASLALLFTSIPSVTNSSGGLSELFYVFSVALPFNVRTVLLLLSPLFAFKVAYWAADKMLQFIDSLG